jgi:beta-phosphoglucomutase
MRAVVFDFDGVIANSEPMHFRGFRDVLGEQGLELTEADYYRVYVGFDDRDAFRAIGADRGVTWTDDRLEVLVRQKAERLEREVPVLFPGAAAAIRRLAPEFTLAIASGAIRPEIVRVLEREDLSRHFAAIVAAGDTPASKPAPDPYLEAVRRLSAAAARPIAAWECVAVEDSRWGIDSARAAGLRTVGITHTYQADALSTAEVVIPSLDLLTKELLAGLAASTSPAL